MLRDIRELINDYLIDIEAIKNKKKKNIKMLKIYNSFNLELYIENNTISQKIKLFKQFQNIFDQIKEEMNFEEFDIYII